MKRLNVWCWSALSLLLWGAPGSAQTTALDARVQAPQLKAPERGSLVGPLSGALFGPADVSRGGFNLSAPFSLPGERGAPLFNPFPSYSPENGLSEWGMGWATQLSITRGRTLGAPLYDATDVLSGPWGRMVRGTDGAWYPSAMSSMVRLEESGTSLVATLPDGSRWTFGGTARTVNGYGTYAWYLTQIETPFGRRTHLTYDVNLSGRHFLKKVAYGGTGLDFQYEAEFLYETLTRPFRDLRSRSEVLLDRRITTVIARVRNADTGAWEERWRHGLVHQGEGLGPAYLLTQVSQTFASGEQLPPTHYTYHLAASHLTGTGAELVRAPTLDGVLVAEGANATQPDQSSLLDIDEDGRLDLEHREDNTLWHQQEGVFVAEPLAPAPPGTPLQCRRGPSTLNQPRLIARMRTADQDLDSNNDLQVVGLLTQNSGLQTQMTLCTREGAVLHTEVLPSGNWTPGANTRLVDVTRDRQPDFIRVSAGRYMVLPNTSTPSQFSFGPLLQGTLTPSFTPTASWLQDMNGDGQADIVARASSTVTVWFGRGDGTFITQGQNYNVRTGNVNIVNLSDFNFSFVDANKDGLTDLLLTRLSGNNSFLFVNDGKDFVFTPVSGLPSVTSVASKPVVGDFHGSGNTEVSYVISQQAWTLALDTPRTGLMASADDGRGTVLTFEYARAPAQPGILSRPVVLAALNSNSSGYDPIRYTYEYDEVRMHSVGGFVVGYGSVVRKGLGAVDSSRFLHSDEYSGLPTSETRHDDQVPQLHSYSYKEYTDAQYRGVSWKRLKEEGSGWVDDEDQTLGLRTEYQAYEDGRCPSLIVRHTQNGTLTIRKTLASLTGLNAALHCLESSTRVTGEHPEATLDFENHVRLTRDSMGTLMKVESLSPLETLVFQTVAYRPDHLIESVTVPGQGTTSFEYETNGTLRLKRVTTPEGMVVEAGLRHPLTDSIQTLVTHRGVRNFSQHFRYDGLERLQKRWNTLGSASELDPNELLSYRYATATQPGNILSRMLVDVAAGSHTTQVDWQTAAGEAMAKAVRLPQGWSVQALTTRSRNQLEVKTYERVPLGAQVDVTTLDYPTLLAGADVVSTLNTTGLGFETSSLMRLHSNVSRQVSTGVALEEGWF